jgi:hypothetical protein
LQGTVNDAGSASTTLTSASVQTLILSNTAAAAPLNLVSHAFPLDPYYVSTGPGDLVNMEGHLLFTHHGGSVGEIYTDTWANMLIPLTSPQRAVDTRGADGRGRIVITDGNFDGQGRLLAGHIIEVDLTDYVFAGRAGFFNLTSVASVAGGYLTMWPTGEKPATSSLNYQKGVPIANGLAVGLSGWDSVLIVASTTTHVILDVMGIFAGSERQVNPAFLPPSTAAASKAAKAAARVAPSWFRADG